MSKRLCRINKRDIVDKLGEISELTYQPQFVCRNCSRVANQSDYLCSPISMKGSDTHAPKMAENNESIQLPALSKKSKKRNKKNLKKLKKMLKKQKALTKKIEKAQSKIAFDNNDFNDSEHLQTLN